MTHEQTIRTALGAYRSALRSGEPESEQMQAAMSNGLAALAALVRERDERDETWAAAVRMTGEAVQHEMDALRRERDALATALQDTKALLEGEPCEREDKGCIVLSNSQRMCPPCRLRLHFHHITRAALSLAGSPEEPGGTLDYTLESHRRTADLFIAPASPEESEPFIDIPGLVPPEESEPRCNPCDGTGWYVGHEAKCYEQGDCSCSGVQIPCNCHAVRPAASPEEGQP